MSIKGGPILYGEEAEKFYKETEEKSNTPSPKLSREQLNRLNNFLKSSEKFSLKLRGNV